MTEELLDETAYQPAGDSGQKSLITAYCGDIEQRIVSALTADEAKGISEEACRTFRKECASALVGKVVTNHVEGLYVKYWGGGNNGAPPTPRHSVIENWVLDVRRWTFLYRG